MRRVNLPRPVSVLGLVVLSSLIASQSVRAQVDYEDVDDGDKQSIKWEPYHYQLRIFTYFLDERFAGNVEIYLRATNVKCEPDDSESCKTYNITLDAGKQLEIVDPKQGDIRVDKRSAKITKAHHDVRNELYTMEISTTKAVRWRSKMKVKLTFTGKMSPASDGLDGLIYSGRKAITRFTKHKASNAFPCFNNPFSMATFNLTLEHLDHVEALSNMHQIGREADDSSGQFVTTRFATTPPMPAFKLTFAFIQTRGLKQYERLAKGIQISILTHQSDDIMDPERLLYRIVDAYGSLHEDTKVGLNSTLKEFRKIDILAVDSALSGAADESWGLITIDYNLLRLRDYYLNFHKLCEALALHWFGLPLGSYKHDNHWLDRGLASWAAEYINRVSARGSGEDQGLQYIGHILQPALVEEALADRLDTNRTKVALLAADFREPVDFDWSSSREKFDEVFKKYFDARSHPQTAAIEERFWSSLGPNLLSWFQTWKQVGIPLIRIALAKDNQTLVLTQQRFGSTQGWSKSTWAVPIRIDVSIKEEFGDIVKVLVLETRSDSLDLGEKHLNWLIVRPGYYRVEYDERLLDALEKPIRGHDVILQARLKFYCDSCELYKWKHITEDAFLRIKSWYSGDGEFFRKLMYECEKW